MSNTEINNNNNDNNNSNNNNYNSNNKNNIEISAVNSGARNFSKGSPLTLKCFMLEALFFNLSVLKGELKAHIHISLYESNTLQE